ARTALYNWLFARRHGGSFVLRIADTDAKRVTDENYRAVLEDMSWLGLTWDEGPEVGGPYGPYRQSERGDLYRDAAAQLVESDAAYRCYCTPEELDARRKAAQAERQTPGYDGRCRHLTDQERAAFEAEGRSFALRFAVPEARKIAFRDEVLGEIATDTAQIPDFIIQRSDGSPTYMLAVTVDDAHMKISHIIRGNDLVASTPRQLLLREAMGLGEVPVFAHLPLLVTESGKPLSKRWGDVSVGSYRDRGFLPEAMVNYLALLGWSFDDKTNVFSVDDLIEKFSLERVGKNPAAFDVSKLEWLNLHYIKQLSPADLAEALVPFCLRDGLEVDSPEGREKLQEVAPLIVERLRRLDEAPPMVRFLFGRQDPDEKASKVLMGQGEYLEAASAALAPLDPWITPAIEACLRALAEERGLKPKQAFQPIRAAVTGTLVSPPLFESLEILGRDETIARLNLATHDPVTKRDAVEGAT
ncbi:MAG: nondiscriminating glutamyl-tRNA synthetase, partial [Actinomycetota bacterium]|nr:nondiscriminating glutamyl-tRNA synthetase [Actinomycetota bacterium]